MQDYQLEKNFKISQHSLTNGFTHIHITPHNDSHFFIGLYIKVGTRWELKKQSGISHFLEHMMFRGSKEHPSFVKLAEKFEQYGGEWNAATGHEHTEYTYIGLKHVALPLIKLFSELIKNPLLLDPEKEQQIILREIEDEMNEFGEFVDLDYHSSKLAWPEPGFNSPITGTQDSVKTLTENMLRDYYKDHYTPENMVICTWGGTDSQQVISDVRENFDFSKPSSHLKSPLFLVPKNSHNSPLFSFVKNSDNQYQVQISFLCEGEWSQKSVRYALICHILSNGFSSRLSKHLRERLGLVYSITSHITSFVDRGLLNFTYATTFDKFYHVLEEFLMILKDFKEKGPSFEETKKAQEQEVLELISLAHDPESYSFFLARNRQWNKEESLENLIENIKSLTAQDIKKEAASLFQSSTCLSVVMGEENLSLKTKVNKLIKSYL